MVQCFLGSPEFPSFCKDLIGNLYVSKSFADISLVGDDNIPVEAHKIVLSAHSNVFREAIFALKCDKIVIQCNGFLNKDINSLLEFMYQGETAREFKDAHVLFRIGKFLQIKHLSDECDIDQDILNKQFSIEAVEVVTDEKIKPEGSFTDPQSQDTLHESEEDAESHMEARIIYIANENHTKDQTQLVEKIHKEAPIVEKLNFETLESSSDPIKIVKTETFNDGYFRDSSAPQGTRRSEQSVVNLYNSVMKSFDKVDPSKEWKSIDETPEDELPTNLSKFFSCLVKPDGTPYTSSCIITYYHSIARYLRSTRSIHMKNDDKFDSVSEAVKHQCKESTEVGLAPGAFSASAFRKEDINQAFDRGCFGRNSPEALVSVVAFDLTIQFGCDNTNDLKKLVNSDFIFGPLNQSGFPEYIQLSDYRVRHDTGSPERCPVMNISIYQSKKTADQSAPGMPFILNPELNTNSKNWFQNCAMGRNSLRSLFRRTLEKAGVDISDQRIRVSSGKLSRARQISLKGL